MTFASVGPIVAMANATPGVDGARAIFGAIIGAGVLSMLLAPVMGRLLRYFPARGHRHHHRGDRHQPDARWAWAGPWAGPAPMAQSVDVPKLVAMVDAAKSAAEAASAPTLKLPGPVPMNNNPAYGALDNLAVAGFVLVVILALVKFGRGFLGNIAVLLGIVAGCVLAAGMGKMNFEKVGKAHWFDVVTPFSFGIPTFDPVLILTMTLVMIVVMIESTGMFLALADITGKKISQQELTAGLRTDGLGTLIGGIFNTFPYTSFSQNVGLVGVTGVRSRFVCVAAGLIMLVLGLLPKMAALVESVPQFVLGGAGAGDVRHGRCHRHPHPLAGRFPAQQAQPLHRRDLHRRRADSTGGAALDATDATPAAPLARVRHPACRLERRGAQSVLQRQPGPEHGRGGRGLEGHGSRTLSGPAFS